MVRDLTHLQLKTYACDCILQEVPVLPVLAKADCMTAGELASFREYVRNTLHHVSISSSLLQTNDSIKSNPLFYFSFLCTHIATVTHLTKRHMLLTC